MKYDDSLVVRAMAGDKEAFESLYRQIYEDMYRFAYFMLGNTDDATDAVSDAVTDMYITFGKLRNYKSFQLWSMKILWSKCKQKRKEYAVKSVEVSIEDSETICKESYEEEYIKNLDLQKQLLSLEEDERTIILLNIIYGFNGREIAKLLKIKPATVRSKKSRAFAKLRERMDEYGI